MNELFRFSMPRAANCTDATTLALERASKFQVNPPNPGPPGLENIVASPRHTWTDLEDASLAYISSVSTINFIKSLDGSTVAEEGKQFLKNIENATHKSWPTEVSKLAESFTPQKARDGLADFDTQLADLFLALLIVRSSGPSHLHEKIRTNNVSAEVTDILLNRPSLDEIAKLLRLVNLIKLASLNPSPLKTAASINAILDATLLVPPKIFESFEKPVHAVGVTDLLVVKQHILRYELGEIARIENILKGESRNHSQKHTLSNERDTFLQTDKETQTDQELTNTDHVKLSNEIENTLKEDTKVDAGLHAQYTGVVNIQADLTVAYDRASEESKKSATEIAKDVTQRAAKKVTERIQQSETTKIIETFEELEEQKFENKDKANTSGVYQWIEKVYLAQVFNYGKHLLFDIMVPEPAASLLAADSVPLKKRPVPPDPLGTIQLLASVGGGIAPVLDDEGNKQLKEPLTPNQLAESPLNAAGNPDPNYYGRWAAKFHALGVQPPPPSLVVFARAKSFPYQDDQFITASEVIPIDDGYRAVAANVTADWMTNDNSQQHLHNAGGNDICSVDVTLGGQVLHSESLLSGGPTPTPYNDSSANPVIFNPPQEKSIAFSIKTVDVDELTINVEIICERSPTAMAKWQLETYEKIAAAWQKLQDDYTVKLEAMKLQQQQTGVLGEAPSEVNRQTERNELKRSCIAILDNKKVLGYNEIDDQPSGTLEHPKIDSPSFFEDGAWVRWFEQAFDWENISYVFYPYFWGRSSQWIPRLQRKYDSDALFEAFLKAGYARVVIPVRNGFRKAVNFYLATGRPWMGGDLPSLGDKTYLPITEEIKEQTGAPGKEKPVGDPWEIRLPTRLIKLRQDDKLPPDWRWLGHDTLYDSQGDFKDPAGSWNWKGDTGG